MIGLKFNKENLVPNMKTIVNAIYVTISILLVHFIFDIFGINISGFPEAVNLFIVIGIALWIKGILDVNYKGKDLL